MRRNEGVTLRGDFLSSVDVIKQYLNYDPDDLLEEGTLVDTLNGFLVDCKTSGLLRAGAAGAMPVEAMAIGMVERNESL